MYSQVKAVIRKKLSSFGQSPSFPTYFLIISFLNSFSILLITHFVSSFIILPLIFSFERSLPLLSVATGRVFRTSLTVILLRHFSNVLRWTPSAVLHTLTQESSQARINYNFFSFFWYFFLKNVYNRLYYKYSDFEFKTIFMGVFYAN